MKVSGILIACLTFFAVAATAFGHHSTAGGFDPQGKPLSITGTVTKIELRNPHSLFWMDVKDDATGEVHNWKIEYGGIWFHTLRTAEGVTRTGATNEKLMFAILKPGMTVSANGIRARDRTLWFSFKTLSDSRGRVLIDGIDVPIRWSVPPSNSP